MLVRNYEFNAILRLTIHFLASLCFESGTVSQFTSGSVACSILFCTFNGHVETKHPLNSSLLPLLLVIVVFHFWKETK